MQLIGYVRGIVWERVRASIGAFVSFKECRAGRLWLISNADGEVWGEPIMNVWNLLGYIWLVSCFTMGVFSLDGGFMKLVMWTIFGAAIWGLHSNMNYVRPFLPLSLRYLDKGFMVISIILLGLLMASIFRKGLKSQG